MLRQGISLLSDIKMTSHFLRDGQEVLFMNSMWKINQSSFPFQTYSNTKDNDYKIRKNLKIRGKTIDMTFKILAIPCF